MRTYTSITTSFAFFASMLFADVGQSFMVPPTIVKYHNSINLDNIRKQDSPPMPIQQASISPSESSAPNTLFFPDQATIIGTATSLMSWALPSMISLWSFATMMTGLFAPSLEQNIAIPIIVIPCSLLLSLWAELRTYTLGAQRSSKTSYRPDKRQDIAMMKADLEEHRLEKVSFLRSQIKTSLVSFAAAIIVSILARDIPNRGILQALSVDAAPSPLLLAQFLSSFVAHQSADSCLDECKPAKPLKTLIAALACNFMLLVHISKQHILFVMFASQLIAQCFVGKTMDDPSWLTFAGSFLGGIALASWKGWLPALPPGMTYPLMYGHFISKVVFGSFHEMMQNASPRKLKWVWRASAILDLCFVSLGFPVSWLSFHLFSFVTYLSAQVANDTIALKALNV